MASTASPLGLPLLSHGAMVTRGVLRIRLTFQDCSWVMTTNRSPAGAAQMAVGFGLPSLVNVVSRMYSDLATSAKVTGTNTNLAFELAFRLEEHLAQAVEGGLVRLRPHSPS